MNIKQSIMDISAQSLLDIFKSTKNILISEKKIMDKKDKHIYPITNAPFSIPNTWEWSYLSDISFIQEGPGIRKHQYRNEGIQFLTVTNILEDSVDLKKSEKYISIEEYNNKYLHFTINKGDIVTACSGGSWGKSSIFDLDSKIILNTSTLRLRFFNDLGDNKYLYYLTKSTYFKKSLSSHSTGQQPNYGYSHYSRIPIPIPPLPEQQRIVSILDEVLEGIAKATANTEKNLLNARELFESYLIELLTPKKDDCQEKTLKEVSVDFGRGKSKHRPRNDPKLYGGQFPFIQTGDVRNSEHLITHYTQTYNETGLSQSKLWPKGTICITIAANIAETGILEFDACFPDSIIGIVVDEKQTSNVYVEFLLQSVKARIKSKGKGSAQDNINLGTFEKEYFLFPTSEKQDRIVKRLEAVSEQVRTLQSIYQQKLIALTELKQSILHKAFTGELTTDYVDKQMEAV